MKCKIPEISWHNRDPVLSVDIQPNKSNGDSSNNYRLASGGTDAHVLIWYMKMTSGKKGDIELDLAADLTRHQRAVNVVKWSPNGELLASGDDESVVFIWKLKSDSEPLNILDTTNEQDKEVWITLKVLRGHMEDIYDLSWAPNSLFLVSGSVDNSAIMWDIAKGKATTILKDHKGFVQGVAWDPKNQYIATLSTDRYLRIFDIQTKKVLHRISKCSLPVSEDNCMHGKSVRLFHDDTLQTFFRRLCFSPDGKLLLTPAGVTDYDGCIHPINTTYAFSRYGFRQPAIVLPCPDQYTVAVNCCPLLFCLRPHDLEKNPPVVPLPYRMIFAVATKSSVYFYDTQQKQPFALISNIHYTRLTDLTWSQDGLVVVVSSTDGFCSLITFEKGELGEVYENSDAVLEAALAQVNSKNGKSKKQKENDNGTKSRKPSLDGYNQSKENTPLQTETVLEKIDEHNKETVSDTKTENDDKADNGKKQDTLKVSPIEIRRKPKGGVTSLPSDETVLEKIDKTKTANNDKAPNEKIQNSPKANRITIKRNPEVEAASLPSDETVLETMDETNKKPVSAIEKPTNTNDAKAQNEKTQNSPKANPIAIRRKADGGATSLPSDETVLEKIDETNKETVSAIETTKTENDDKKQNENISKSPKANPIAIRRKPGGAASLQRDETVLEKIGETNKETVSAIETPTNTNDAKAQNEKKQNSPKANPIAIRRKPEGGATSLPRDETVLETIETNKESVSAIKITENDNKAQNENKQNTLKANPIAVKKKPEGGAASLSSDETVLKTKDETNKETESAKEITTDTNDDKVENEKNQNTPKANRIAIKRKPEVEASPATSDEAKRNSEEASSISPDKPATPIAIKRKPASGGKTTSQPAAANDREDQCTPPKAGKSVITSKVLTGDIILDREILSSVEKFESPEKKSRPVTPISVRRHPRTPSQTPKQASESPTSFAKIITSSTDNFNNSSPKQTKTPHQEKKAKPIAVRRIPRTKISTPTVVHTPNMVEEAMDAWPLAKDGEDANKDADKCNKGSPKETGVYPLPSEVAADQTEDIRLVYEDTVEEASTEEAPKCSTSAEKAIIVPANAEIKTGTNPSSGEKVTENHPEQETANNKTPKRVTLRTISTPKSKKKLME